MRYYCVLKFSVVNKQVSVLSIGTKEEIVSEVGKLLEERLVGGRQRSITIDLLGPENNLLDLSEAS